MKELYRTKIDGIGLIVGFDDKEYTAEEESALWKDLCRVLLAAEKKGVEK